MFIAGEPWITLNMIRARIFLQFLFLKKDSQSYRIRYVICLILEPSGGKQRNFGYVFRACGSNQQHLPGHNLQQFRFNAPDIMFCTHELQNPENYRKWWRHSTGYNWLDIWLWHSNREIMTGNYYCPLHTHFCVSVHVHDFCKCHLWL